MFERILVPLDGSARAEAVLDALAPVLARRETQVLLLRAERAAAALGGSEFVYARVDPVAEAKAYLDPLEERLTQQGVRARSRVREGPAAESILDAARAFDATLIAMATHGRSGIARWLLGSVAERVVRDATVPVLVFRSFPPAEPGGAFDPILVPIHRSDGRILPCLKEFAELFGSTSIVLHVEGKKPDDGAVESTIMARDLQRAGLPAEVRERRGDAVREILREAREDGAGLIAMSTRDARATAKVLRKSPAPLLVVR